MIFLFECVCFTHGGGGFVALLFKKKEFFFIFIQFFFSKVMTFSRALIVDGSLLQWLWIKKKNCSIPKFFSLNPFWYYASLARHRVFMPYHAMTSCTWHQRPKPSKFFFGNGWQNNYQRQLKIGCQPAVQLTYMSYMTMRWFR